ncbi:MAG: mannonate dehydratase [Planctomycetes bacterium]|nr:mannonate dehydratase [Planctomycetota bacterium]
MMEIAEILPPPADRLWRLVKQCGVRRVVGTWGGRGRQDAGAGGPPWGYERLARLKEDYEREGFELAVLECRPPMNKVKLGLAGQDEELEAVCDLLRNMGKLGIPVWCYEWMPVINWIRTSTSAQSRGGALVTAFDLAQVKDPPVTEHGPVTEERLWECLRRFLERVVPVAEKAGVKLAMHPDDPPLSPVRGMARIMRSVEGFQRLVDLVPSPANGVCLCQGNFALMTGDLPGVIRRFGGQKVITFVHFRDVRGTPERFEETFHDDGKTDMAACMRAYRDVGFDGVCRPDHVPTMDGDSNDHPGYSTIGRLFAVGYIRGLQQAVWSEAPAAAGR